MSEELHAYRDVTASPTDLVVVFAARSELLRTELDDRVFRALLPKVQALAGAPRAGIVGSAAEREAGERDGEAVEEG